MNIEQEGRNGVQMAGLRPGALLAARLGVLATATLGAIAESLAATALVFDAARWSTYAAANVLIALTYAVIGAARPRRPTDPPRPARASHRVRLQGAGR